MTAQVNGIVGEQLHQAQGIAMGKQHQFQKQHMEQDIQMWRG